MANCTRLPLSPPSENSRRISPELAFQLLKELCAFGPRHNGSEGKLRADGWIIQKLKEAGAEVAVQEFSHTAKDATQPASFKNIIGRIRPNEKLRVLLGTHYDTRSWADRDQQIENREKPIIGANDGGSGVAVILALAAVWKDHPPPIGVDLIFFDGEDFGRRGVLQDYFLGSKAWMNANPNYQVEWGIILDMVGDADLQIRQELDSVNRAPRVVERIWQAAERVGADAFSHRSGNKILDDQTAFLDRGIPVALLIDFDYPFHHTLDDTLDKCSADSLGQVGKVVMDAIEQHMQH